MSDDVVVQAESSDGSFECRSFIGVPASRASWIVIASSGSAAGRNLVGQLKIELEALLMSSSPEVQAADCASAPDPISADLNVHHDRRKLLVLVASTDRKLDDQAWYSRWWSDDAAVLTVLPPGPFEDFFAPAILEDESHLLRRVNACRWRQHVTEALPTILARAEVTTAQSRVFISYRRLETLELALQLFDRLTHEGFEVFLDRFSIPPGHDFQRRLNQELADKSMVLLLESRHAVDSKWTQHEIDFAKRHRLGLMSLRMPDVDADHLIPAISYDRRIELSHGDFAQPPAVVTNPDHSDETMNAWPCLSDENLERVVAELKAAHASALFRRRHRLRTDVKAMLGKHPGVVCDLQAPGALRVGCGVDEHLLWLTTRPVEVDDFRALYATHKARPRASANSRAVLLGPQAALEPDRRQRLDWLAAMTGCLCFDEGNLSELARRLAVGAWT